MISDMIQELITTSGKLGKVRVLKKYDTPDIRRLLQFTYDTNYVYGVRPNKVSPLSVVNRTTLHRDERLLLSKLHCRELTGSAAVQAVETMSLDNGPLIKLILDRDLQCGIAAKTINKAMPCCIPMFEVQLAKDVPLHRVQFPMYAQLKYDGVRLITTIKDGVVVFRTRNGKRVNLPYLRNRIETTGINETMLDGELIFKGGDVSTRTSVSGLVNSAMHGGTVDESPLEYVLFDILPLHEFEAGVCSSSYDWRHSKVESAVSMIGSPTAVAKRELVRTVETVNMMADALYENGFEGLILKKPRHIYSFKRSADWVKIKEIKTADLVVLGAVEGTGKYETMIGALDCHGVVEGKQVIVSVGSGLTDLQRSGPMNAYDNKIIEVKYNSLIKDSRTNQWSLFLPRFVCVRSDK